MHLTSKLSSLCGLLSVTVRHDYTPMYEQCTFVSNRVGAVLGDHLHRPGLTVKNIFIAVAAQCSDSIQATLLLNTVQSKRFNKVTIRKRHTIWKP
jgi:hypothetical protein